MVVRRLGRMVRQLVRRISLACRVVWLVVRLSRMRLVRQLLRVLLLLLRMLWVLRLRRG